MRARLTLILFVPSLLLLVMLGVAYVTSAARAEQQRVYVDRLRDASYLTIAARESIRVDDPGLVDDDLQRYRDVYGVKAAVVHTSGSVWASNGLELDGLDAHLAAISGRRAEFEASAVPWHVTEVVIAEPVYDGGDLVGAVVTTSDVQHLARDIWRNWALLIGSGLLLIALAHFAARRTADWVLQPVHRVNRAMSHMGGGQLDERIPASVGPPELRDVTARFNEMAERVQRLVRKQQEFVHNASHELRNPLTALTLRVEELALDAPPDQVDAVNALRGETERLRQILDALLLLADDDPSEGTLIDLTTLVENRAAAWRRLTPDRTVTCDLPDRAAEAVVNPAAVESALDTVIDNAVKFSPATEPIELALRTNDHAVEIIVRDHGPGIPTDQLVSATERFWRSPTHRSVRGSGLGLSIATDLLASVGGDVLLELPDDGGLRVRLRIPAGGEN